MFVKYDADGNGDMSKEEFRDYFRAVMGKDVTNEEADEAFTSLVGEGGSITLQVFQEGILKSNKNKSSGLPGECPRNCRLIISPSIFILISSS